MIFTRHSILRILENCKCPTRDTPDDMYIGACIKNLDIMFIHTDLLHQARPYDYSKDYLKNQEPISFHKYWNCDPLKVYQTFLSNDKNNIKRKKESKYSNEL